MLEDLSRRLYPGCPRARKRGKIEEEDEDDDEDEN